MFGRLSGWQPPSLDGIITDCDLVKNLYVVEVFTQQHKKADN